MHTVIYNEWKSLQKADIYPSGNNWAGTFLRHKKPRQYKKSFNIYASRGKLIFKELRLKYSIVQYL